MLIYSSLSALFSCGVQVPLGGREWVDQWEWSDIYSTRWTQGTQVGQRRREMCAGVGSPRRRKRSGIRRRSPTGPQHDASGARARWPAPCCCAVPPRSCCTGRAPTRPSSCQSTRAWGLICRLYPQRTCCGVENSVTHRWKTQTFKGYPKRQKEFPLTMCFPQSKPPSSDAHCR